jgi:hypothetical protein
MHHPVTLDPALDWLFNLHEPGKAAMLVKGMLKQCAGRLYGTQSLGIFTVFLPFGSGLRRSHQHSGRGRRGSKRPS